MQEALRFDAIEDPRCDCGALTPSGFATFAKHTESAPKFRSAEFGGGRVGAASAVLSCKKQDRLNGRPCSLWIILLEKVYLSGLLFQGEVDLGL